MDPIICIDSYHATAPAACIPLTSKPLPALLAPPAAIHDTPSNNGGGGSLSSFFSSTSSLSLHHHQRQKSNNSSIYAAPANEQQQDHAYLFHPPSSTAYYTVIQKQSQEIQDLRQDLILLNQKYISQFDRIQIAEQAQHQVESELEDLSRKLFEQANEMVSQEKKARFLAEKRVAQLERELKCVYEALDNERDQLNELRRKFEENQQEQSVHPLVVMTTTARSSTDTAEDSISSSSESSWSDTSTKMMDSTNIYLDDGWLSLFKNFLSVAPNTPLESLHRLPFLKQCMDLDIEPCLRFGIKSKLSIKRVLDAILRQPCFIESSSSSSSEIKAKRYSHDDRSVNSSDSNSGCLGVPNQHQPVVRRSSFAFINKLKAPPSADQQQQQDIYCYGCGNLIKQRGESNKLFKFKLKESDTEWYWIDRGCRDRLVAVCDFYVFIRHLREGGKKNKPVQSLFQECVWLRLVMFWARSGVHHHNHQR